MEGAGGATYPAIQGQAQTEHERGCWPKPGRWLQATAQLWRQECLPAEKKASPELVDHRVTSELEAPMRPPPQHLPLMNGLPSLGAKTAPLEGKAASPHQVGNHLTRHMTSL